MNRWISSICLCLVASMATAQVVDKNYDGGTGSLWNDQRGSAFIDRTARAEGDLVTIVISETSAANFAATTTLNKADNTTIDPSFFKGILKQFFNNLTSSDSSTTNGGGTSVQNNKMTAKLTAVVTKVYPNGNMRIEGTRSLVVNKEVQSFKISAIVRRDDISADNSVKSENLAEADIQMVGKGAIHERQRRGLITRVLDWLF